MAKQLSVTQINYVIEKANEALKDKVTALKKKYRFNELNYNDHQAMKEIIATGDFILTNISKRRLINIYKKGGYDTIDITDITNVESILFLQKQNNNKIEAKIDKALCIARNNFKELERTCMLSTADEIAKQLKAFEASVAKIKG